jgi:phosphate acetyltransferase
MDVIDFLRRKARANPKRIVFPEGENPNILEAALELRDAGLARPILLGDPGVVAQAAAERRTDLAGVACFNPAADPGLEKYVAVYSQSRGLPERVGRRFMIQPLYYGAMMVKVGDADGLVAGISQATEEVIMASELVIGLRPGTSLASSFFLMQPPGFGGGQDGLLIFADPAVNPDPSAEELADIAVTTAHSARELFGWEPRVALLSFSTKGSAQHPRVDKVVRAVELAREKAPDLLIEGEMQADAALVEAVAKKKIGPDNPVAGKANILIFPDLDSANIASKLVQRLAGAASYGPIIQGFALPVSDLSRGAATRDIVGAALMVTARALS